MAFSAVALKTSRLSRSAPNASKLFTKFNSNPSNPTTLFSSHFCTKNTFSLDWGHDPEGEVKWIFTSKSPHWIEGTVNPGHDPHYEQHLGLQITVMDLPLPGGTLTGKLKTLADEEEGVLYIEGVQKMGEKTTEFKGQVPLIPGLHYRYLDVKGVAEKDHPTVHITIPANICCFDPARFESRKN